MNETLTAQDALTLLFLLVFMLSCCAVIVGVMKTWCIKCNLIKRLTKWIREKGK